MLWGAKRCRARRGHATIPRSLSFQSAPLYSARVQMIHRTVRPMPRHTLPTALGRTVSCRRKAGVARESVTIGVGAIWKQALGAALRSNCRHGLPYHHALEHHTVELLWLGILPRFAQRKDLNFDPSGLGGFSGLLSSIFVFQFFQFSIFVLGALFVWAKQKGIICGTEIDAQHQVYTGSGSRRPGDTRRTAAGPASSSTAPGTSSPTTRHTTAPTAQRCRRTRKIRTVNSFSTAPRGGTTPLPRHAQPLLLLFRSNPPH